MSVERKIMRKIFQEQMMATGGLKLIKKLYIKRTKYNWVY